MKPHSKTDWERVKREAAQGKQVAFDASVEPYNPNDEASVTAFWTQANVQRRGSQKAPLKVPTTIRFDADVLAALKASGRGWQTRVNAAMREWVKTHPHSS
jgi:uncharacterized protein (DUF4415 family)